MRHFSWLLWLKYSKIIVGKWTYIIIFINPLTALDVYIRPNP